MHTQVDLPPNHPLNLPDDWWKTSAASKTFSFFLLPHMLQLSISYLLNGHIYRQPSTGLLIESGLTLLWLTAGHVIDAIEDLRTNPSYRVTDLRWLDRFPKKDVQTLPVSDRNFRTFSTYGSRQDIGAILIPPLDAENLRNNPNIRPMTIKEGHVDSSRRDEGFVLVGFPWEQAILDEKPETASQSRITLTSDLACLPLQPVEPPSPSAHEEFWDDPHAFYARVLEYADLGADQPQDLRGMSGGPIFSFERLQIGLRTTLVAVYASYRHRDRVIRAEPVGRVFKAIDEWIGSSGAHAAFPDA